jgi:N-acyl-D-amino-acid deacylase
MGRVGHGVFEMASDMRREWDDFGWMGALSRETGLPCTYAALQSIAKEMPLDEQIARCARKCDNGANIVAQIALRGNGIIMAWRGTVHPFRFRPAGWRSPNCLGPSNGRGLPILPSRRGCWPNPTK